MRTFAVIIMLLLSILYLLNPTMGIFELIPDNIPLVGNLDEAGATALLIMCFRYFGCDISKLFDRNKKDNEDLYEVQIDILTSEKRPIILLNIFKEGST